MGLWNVRRRIKKGDYVYVLVPEHPKATKNGYVLEHRVVMENKIGRMLDDSEVVHHIDGNRKNNSDDNLLLMLTSEHNSFHASERGEKLKKHNASTYGNGCRCDKCRIANTLHMREYRKNKKPK